LKPRPDVPNGLAVPFASVACLGVFGGFAGATPAPFIKQALVDDVMGAIEVLTDVHARSQ
jgi:hypothetical protein